MTTISKKYICSFLELVQGNVNYTILRNKAFRAARRNDFQNWITGVFVLLVLGSDLYGQNTLVRQYPNF